LADEAVGLTKFANGIEPVSIVTGGALPTVKSTSIIWYGNKLYRWDGSAYTAAVPTADLTGTVADAQIAGMAASKVTGQLTNAQLEAIAAAKITGQVTSTQITDGAISTLKLAAGAVTAAQIAADTITAAQIAAGAVTATELAAGSVVAGKIAAGTIQAADIAAGTITGDRLAANTITAGQIAADTITAGQIAAGAIGAQQIAAGAITTGKLLVTGSGASLWPDPGFQDSNAWVYDLPWAGAPTQVQLGDGVAGASAMRGAPTGAARGKRRIPVTIGARYRVSIKVRRSADCPGPLYLRLDVGTTESGAYGEWAIGVETIFPPANTWTTYAGEWVADKPFVAPMVLLAHTATVGYMEAQDIRIKEMTGADLIVDGAIIASKIAAGAIAVGSAAIQDGAIRNALIENLAVDDAKVANLSVSKLLAGSLSVGQYIQSTNYTDGASGAGFRIGRDVVELPSTAIRGRMTANQIDGEGLSITYGGAPVLVSGSLALSAVPAGALNSNQQWSEISGVGKPYDNATVGATIGVNLGGQITNANASTYIANAALGWAQIGDLYVNTGGGVRSGKVSYGSGTGWLLEYNGGTPRLDIGSDSRYLRWTGSDLEIGGDIVATGNIVDGAVRAISGAGLASSFTLSTSEQVVCAASVNTANSALWAYVEYYLVNTDGSVSSTVEMQIRVAGSIMRTYTVGVAKQGGTARGYFSKFINSPGSGDLSVQIVMRIISGNSSTTSALPDTFIFALGSKR